MKKVWSKPKLIVLIKGTSQESVLTYCQNGGPGPTVDHSECQYTVSCIDCASITPP